MPEERRKRKVRTLELQLDYVLARNIPQSDIRKSRTAQDVGFLTFGYLTLATIQFFSASRYGFTRVPLQPKLDMAGLKDEECRKKFQRVSIHAGVQNTKAVQMPRKKIAFASAETKSTYNSVCVARSTGDFNQEKRLRRKLRRQLQQDRDNKGTSRAMEFEKAWEDKNPRKAYALLNSIAAKQKDVLLSLTLPMEWLSVKQPFQFAGITSRPC
ncbi:hypothetical protein RB195_001469 [Necator americanus]|uniref:Uncharacterized protein n=1 Tax=Necator americanus TaxID=51031 RepID=A0ABR1DFB5_NECAM